MPSPEKVVESAAADRLKVHAGVVQKRISDFGIAKFKYRQPDFAALEKAMKAGAKTTWSIRFENDKLVATAQCAGTNLTVAAADLAKETDRATRRRADTTPALPGAVEACPKRLENRGPTRRCYGATSNSCSGLGSRLPPASM